MIITMVLNTNIIFRIKYETVRTRTFDTVSTQFVCMRESTKELEQESTTFLNAALHSTDSIKVKVMCLVRSGVIVGQSVVTAYSLVM